MSEIIADVPTAASSGSSVRRWLSLFVVLTAQLMVVLDTTVVNVALPAVQADFDVSQADLTWVLNGYLVSYGSLLLVAGRLGDLVGRKKVFLAGVATFTAASAGCALADTATTLVAARFVQGVGGALASATAFAILVAEFTAPAERAKAISYYMLVSIGGGSAGLLLGGILTQALDWHWIFAINLPIGVLALVAGILLVSEQPGLGWSRGADLLGAVLVTAALVIGIDAIVQAADAGWASFRTLGLGALALVLLGAFGVREATAADPLLPPRILRLRTLVRASVVRAVVVCGMYGMFFFGALYLQQILSYDAFETGLAFLPQTVTVAVCSMVLTVRLVRRFGPVPVLAGGLVTMIAGLLVLAAAPADASYFPVLFVAFVLSGIGGGTAFMPLTTLAVSEVPPADAGLGSGIVNVTMQISAAIGLAVLGTVATNHTKALVRAGHQQSAALAGGNDLGLLVAAGCVGAGLVLTGLLLRTPPTPDTPKINLLGPRRTDVNVGEL